MYDMIQKYITARSAVKIALQFERCITDGHIASGEKLPAIRGLAATLSVSPGTIVSAYDSLKQRG